MPHRTPAAHKPVARVLPLLGVAHLDRGFDYRVSEEQSAEAQPGVRVRIRFNGRLSDAIVLERRSESEFPGELRYLERVISPYAVYPPRLARLVDSLADRYGGVRSDIIRSAIPPRHAKAEESDLDSTWEELGNAGEPDLSGWSAYEHGESFVDSVLGGNVARAAWQIAPGDDWAGALAALSVKIAISGKGVLLVVPNQKCVAQLEAALREYVSAKQVTVLGNSIGPQARYRRYLSALVGQSRIVVGTRSAAFTPVHNLRLAVIVHDGDDNLVDSLKPYVHAREVLSTRCAQEGCSLILAGHSRTAETQLLVESGWAHDLVASESTIRARRPAIAAVGTYGFSVARDMQGGTTSVAGPAYQAAASALERGKPVLVQVPRKGYAPILACGQCRAPARCRHCNGPLGLGLDPQHPGGQGQASLPTCAWCGRVDSKHRCSECGSPRLRAIVLGAQRTAEELGRAFARTRIVVSGGNKIIDEIDTQPCLVIATPGAEPLLRGGGRYGAALLLDGASLLGRQDLRATEDTLATWAQAATLVEPASQAGRVIVVADEELPVVKDLLAWDMAGAARRELEERREVRFPPAVHMAAVDGADKALDAFLDLVELPAHAEVLGPVPLPAGQQLPGEYDRQRWGPAQRVLIRVPLGPRAELGTALRCANAARSARKEDVPLRIQVDPIHVG
ncbi:primosomal protein N' [Corynebacterium flavescens]|uniref:primosomal protein N' n=1 Tax=Corynebacterium flavescens TaxID=28028 RepID=UPI000EDEE80B|nr:primosomal protein N' [Corynebacterium flavescens]MDN6236689.1 primosomal protein N' [Corynebacterium flavescens]MDN6552335.1 primosomal protein N' [Corynebacterium flavescens]HCG45958.1 primosome assembly protein PriA [Corynebacterium flavescens]